MKNLEDLNNTVVLSDFDGTITTFDTNTRLFDRLAEREYIEKLRERYRNGEIDLKTLFNLHFSNVSLSEDQYLDYILNEVELQKGFKRFYNNLRDQNIPFSIVSGGFETGIKPFLKKHGFEGIPIYANKLIFDGERVKVEYYDEEYLSHVIDEDHYVDCKVEILKDYRKRYDNIIFLGDGSTDIHVAEKVDILFAKDYLEEYCIQKNIDYIGWEDFDDINEWFKK